MIREMRKRIGLTQAQLASKCGVTQAYISLIEKREENNVSLKVAVKLSEALHVPVSEIVSACAGGQNERYIS